MKTLDKSVRKVYTMDKYKLSDEQVQKIRDILAKGDRIELIPCKDGIKVIQETRSEIK